MKAIEHVKAAETAQKNVEQWRQELVSERELLAQELRMISAAVDTTSAAVEELVNRASRVGRVIGVQAPARARKIG